MKKGQMFSLDLVIALTLIIATLAAVVQLKANFADRTAESLRSTKLHQLANDAAALEYYDSGVRLGELNDSATSLGYVLKKDSASDYDTCFKSTRGTKDSSVEVLACEKKD